MQLSLLHLDDALKSQSAFIKTCDDDKAMHIDVQPLGNKIRLWGKQAQLDELQATLNAALRHQSDEPHLCFMGSGDFHHITALLIENALKNQSGSITIIHFDNHPDWVHFENGMHCGSWVNRATSHPMVEKIITIGVCSHDLRNPDLKGANLHLLSQGLLELFPYAHAPSRVRHNYGAGACYQQKDNHIHWQPISQMSEPSFIALLLERIKTQSVYITIDKDVLNHEDAQTNWDQGIMRLPFLLDIVREIGEHHTIIGADVNGDYSVPHYSGSAWTRLKKHAEIFIDQPRHTPDMQKANALNSATNLAILDVLTQVMA